MPNNQDTGKREVLHSWQIRVPSAFRNPPLFKTLFFATMFPAPIFVFIVGSIASGDPAGMLSALKAGMIVGFGLFILTLFASLVVSRGDVSYVISPKGVHFTVGKFIRGINRAAAIGGAAGGSTAATGAGILAATREDETFPWKDARTVRIYRRQRMILLVRRSWIATMSIYLNADNYDAVRETVLKNCPKARVIEK